jgi:D-alanyl-D-alanine carboxypeptidase
MDYLCGTEGLPYNVLFIFQPAEEGTRGARAMLDHGFSLYEKVTVCEAGEEEYTLPVSGSYLESVRVSNKEAFSAVLRKGGGEITKKTELPHFVYAGQNRENPIGRVRYFRDGAEIGSVPLYLDGDVPQKEAKKGFFSK